jgi:hypothetical protein
MQGRTLHRPPPATAAADAHASGATTFAVADSVQSCIVRYEPPDTSSTSTTSTAATVAAAAAGTATAVAAAGTATAGTAAAATAPLRKYAVGDTLDVLYGRIWLEGRVTRARGRGCYDVVYTSDKQKEAAVPGSRLRPRRTPPCLTLKHFSNSSSVSTSSSSTSWSPFVCVPVHAQGSPLGVLCIDSWNSVPLGRPDKELHPAVPVLSFLQEVRHFDY